MTAVLGVTRVDNAAFSLESLPTHGVSDHNITKVALKRFQTLLIPNSMSLWTQTPFQTGFWKVLKNCDVMVKRG